MLIGLVILILALAQGTWAQEGATQRLPFQEFQSRFLQAFVAHDQATMVALVKGHRDFVKPGVGKLLDGFLEADLQGNAPEAERDLVVATILAEIYKGISQEGLPLKKVALYKSWSHEEKKLKGEGDLAVHEAEEAYGRGNFQEAIAKGQQALERYRKLRDWEGQGRSLHILGLAARRMGDYQAAITFHQQSLVVAQEIGDRQMEGRAVIDLGDVYERQKDWPMAIDLYRKAIRVLRNPDDWRELGRALRQLGDIYVEQGDFEIAYSLYRQALQYAEEFDDKQQKAEYLDYIGYFYRRLGNYEAAIKHHTLALGNAEHIEDKKAKAKAMARALNHRGLAHIGLGDEGLGVKIAGPREGLSSGLEVYAMEFDDKSQQVAEKYYETARTDEEQALQNATEADDQSRKGYALRALSVVYQRLGEITSGDKKLRNYQAALKYSQLAFEVATSMREPEWKGLAFLNTGRAFAGLGEYQEALNAFQESLKIWKAIGDIEMEAATYRYIGYYIHVKFGKDQEAVATYQQALRLFESIGASDLVVLTQHSIGRALERLGKSDEAVDAYAASIQALETMRQRLTIEEHKTTFFEARLDPYDSMISLLADMYRKTRTYDYAERAFHYAERAKARVLVELLAGARLSAVKGLPPELVTQEGEMEREVIARQKALEQLATTPGVPQTRLAEARAELTRAEKAIEAFVARLKQGPPSHRAYAVLKYPHPPTIPDLPLKPDEVLLEFWVTEAATYLWVLRKDHPLRFFSIPGRHALQTQVEAFLAPFRASPPALDAFDPAKAYDIYSFLKLKEVLAGISQGTRLVIVPDDALFRLPFELLVTDVEELRRQYIAGWIPFYPGVRYLGERYPISYAPSAGVLLVTRTQPQPESWAYPLLALGDPRYGSEEPLGPRHAGRGGWSLRAAAAAQGYYFPPLPATEQEVEAIAKVLQVPAEPPHVLTDQEATKAALLEANAQGRLKAYRFLHLATHGILGMDVPGLKQPALVLAREDADERSMFLTMAEVFGLHLNAELVVLSACQTGRGKEIRGEGVMGLTRAFLYAGTPSVVVSLWSVNDESTAHFMTRFYHYFVNEKLDKPMALQKARLDLLNGYTDLETGAKIHYPHPFFWAPFILIGDLR